MQNLVLEKKPYRLSNTILAKAQKYEKDCFQRTSWFDFGIKVSFFPSIS